MNQKYLRNVATLCIWVDKCIGCGRCLEVCPHNVFNLQEKKVFIVDKNSCMECGGCAKNCPTNAINVDAGVGCVSAVVKGWLTGSEPSCDCSGGGDCC